MIKFSIFNDVQLKPIHKIMGISALGLLRKLKHESWNVQVVTKNIEDGDGGLLWPIKSVSVHNIAGRNTFKITVGSRKIIKNGAEVFDHAKFSAKSFKGRDRRFLSECQIVVAGLPEGECTWIREIEEIGQFKAYYLYNFNE